MKTLSVVTVYEASLEDSAMLGSAEKQFLHRLTLKVRIHDGDGNLQGSYQERLKG